MASREKTKNRRDERLFTGLPHHIFRADAATGKPAPVSILTHSAFHLLVNMAAQFNGYNNGDLAAAPKIMKLYGWNSHGNLAKSLTELQETGFIQMTREGGRNKCSLYALTWKRINECKRNLDVEETKVASNLWKKEE